MAEPAGREVDEGRTDVIGTLPPQFRDTSSDLIKASLAGSSSRINDAVWKRFRDFSEKWFPAEH